MFKKYLFVLLTPLVLFIVMGFSSVSAQSNEAIGLAISPPVNEKQINPGEKFSGVIKVSNPTNQDLNVATSVKYFTAKGDEGSPDILDIEDANFSLAKWVEIEKSFKLKSQESKEIKYTINVPKDAEAGGHYGVILFTPSAIFGQTAPGSGTAVAAVSQIGSLFLVSVNGLINYDGKIAEFGTNKTLYLNTTNLVDFVTRFQNLSNIHVKPAGNITIKNAFGKKVAELKVNEKAGNVLPQSIRKFTNDWSKKYGFGWYKASVNLNYGDGQNVSAALMFWIIPWKETLGVIIIIIVLIWIAKHIEWKKKQQKKCHLRSMIDLKEE